jgi:hypothetical protein
MGYRSTIGKTVLFFIIALIFCFICIATAIAETPVGVIGFFISLCLDRNVKAMNWFLTKKIKQLVSALMKEIDG